MSDLTGRFAGGLLRGTGSALASLLLMGCLTPCQSLNAVVAGWDFDEMCVNSMCGVSCTDALCGFVVTQGSGTLVAPVHPADHSLQLAPGSVITRRFTASVQSGVSPVVELRVRCDAQTTLRVSLDSTYSNVFGTPLGPTQRNSQMSVLGVTTLWQTLAYTFDAPPMSTTDSVEATVDMGIALAGTGGCILDGITYSQLPYLCR